MSAQAKGVPALVLRDNPKVLPEEFSNVIGLRELSDGRLLLSDGRERRVVVADFASGAVVQVGRLGRGPGEYASAARLQMLASDSTLLIDSERRWVIFHKDHVVVVRAVDDPVGLATVGKEEPRIDTLGRVVFRVQPPPGANTGPKDSLRVVLVARGAARQDTVLRLRAAPIHRTFIDRPGGERATVNTREPFAVAEEELLFPDGWIAVARLEPYRVDWLRPDGQLVRGAPLPATLQRVDAAIRRAIADSNPVRPGRPPGVDLTAFPSFVPPFQFGALLALPDGRLLIRRTATAVVPNPPFDIVDRRGRLVGTVQMPTGARLLGVGRRGVYLVRADADGVQKVARYDWP